MLHRWACRRFGARSAFLSHPHAAQQTASCRSVEDGGGHRRLCAFCGRGGARPRRPRDGRRGGRSEEHTSEIQSLMRISYAVFCLTKKQPKQASTISLRTTVQITNT